LGGAFTKTKYLTNYLPVVFVFLSIIFVFLMLFPQFIGTFLAFFIDKSFLLSID
jgi:hypothetical protein